MLSCITLGQPLFRVGWYRKLDVGFLSAVFVQRRSVKALEVKSVPIRVRNEVSICVSRWDEAISHGESLSHPLTRLVLTSLLSTRY
jgi:hypothetical protein